MPMFIYNTGFPCEVPCGGCGWPLYCCLCSLDNEDDEDDEEEDLTTTTPIVIPNDKTNNGSVESQKVDNIV